MGSGKNEQNRTEQKFKKKKCHISISKMLMLSSQLPAAILFYCKRQRRNLLIWAKTHWCAAMSVLWLAA